MSLLEKILHVPPARERRASKHMNVAMFTNNYKPFVGGVPIAIDKLAERLRQRGHRVYVFAPDYGKHEEESAGEKDVIRVPSLRNFNDTEFAMPWPLTLEPYTQFGDLDVDVVHVHHPFLLGEVGMHAGRSANLPVVFTYHTQYEKYAHYLPFGEKMVEEIAVNLSTRFANTCDAIIAPSTDIKKTLVERGVTVPIRVIPTGVDLQQFRRGKRGVLRKQLNIPESSRVMLFLSRLAKEKNVGFLFDAFARLAAKDPDLHFVLVGSGDEEENLKAKAAELGLGERTHFTGTKSGDDVISAYKGADLFVFASTTETQGMVVLEAMAGGLPVVAVDAPGVRDIVVEGQNGFLVPEGDVEAFVARCEQVFAEPDIRAVLKKGAEERSRALSLANTTRKVEQVYEQVRRNPHPEREERFLLLREIFHSQFRALAQGIQDLIP